MYIFMTDDRWTHARALPPSYGNYDFNNGHRIIIRDYNGTRPYYYFRDHRVNFPKGRYFAPEKNYWSVKEYKVKGKNNSFQGNGYRQDNKKGVKEYNKEVKKNNKGNGNQGNGRGNGHGKGNGKGHKK
jgi:hypothetical protein